MQAAGDDPHQRVLAVFDALATVVDRPDFRGCRYLAADLALADPDHPAHEVTRHYRERLHHLFQTELLALTHPRPDEAAAQLVLLIDGLLAAAATRPAIQPAALARSLAEQVLAGGQPVALRAAPADAGSDVPVAIGRRGSRS